MKQKYIVTLIIFCSLLSGALASYVLVAFLYPLYPSQESSPVRQQEIITQGKITTVTTFQSEITDLVEKVWPGVVNIIIKKDIAQYRRDPWGFFSSLNTKEERQVWWGSGFFIEKSGVILTNKHVISDRNAKYVIITNNGAEYDASVVALDTITDLWVLKIENPQQEFPVLPITISEWSVNIGQFAVAIGNALWEFQNSVSFGVVSGKNRSIEAAMPGSNKTEKLTGLFQTDAAINPGNSGGPLLNLDGEVIGVNTAIASGQGLGFTIPMTQKRVDYILESIEKHGTIKRPFIGIHYVDVTSELVLEWWLPYTYWAFVSQEQDAIIKDGPAYRSGIQPGDLILEVDGNKISLQSPISSLIQNKIPGDIIELKIYRSNRDEEEIVSLVLWEY